ncbi:Werner Syndrome-like exonuclease [Arachis ipaensis]|uniref:Werner Syndrome-like exonuclease n=1 Tax=Arachis ipaensis TaxID=130454 RepID=UPI0007AF7D9A|nr:Werner Syndrome-like exonuclease [Arachis ipaensis]
MVWERNLPLFWGRLPPQLYIDIRPCSDGEMLEKATADSSNNSSQWETPTTTRTTTHPLKGVGQHSPSSASLTTTFLLNHHSTTTTTTVLVGLDIEWRPNTHRNSDNPVATLQLCVGNRCLVFQILHSPSVPQSLVDFLVNEGHTFLGVGIEEDVEKLLEDYNLNVKNFVDLRGLAESVLGESEMKRAGLKRLAERVLGLEIEKPKRISRSRWDNAWLTAEQVQYACVDAFVSFEVGRMLYGSGNGN